MSIWAADLLPASILGCHCREDHRHEAVRLVAHVSLADLELGQGSRGDALVLDRAVAVLLAEALHPGAAGRKQQEQHTYNTI